MDARTPSPPDVDRGDDWFDAPGKPGGAAKPPADARPARSSARTWVLAGVGTVAIAAAAIAGISFASSRSATDDASTQAATGAPGPGGPGGGPGGIGTITAIDGSTLTVDLQSMGPPGQADGSRSATSTKVVTSADTRITVSTTAAVSDVQVGDHITVMGTTSDSTIAAQSISDTGAQESTGPAAGGVPPSGAPSGASGSAPAPPSGADANGTPPSLPTGADTQGGAFGPGGPGGVAGGRPTQGVVVGNDGATITMTTTDGTTVQVTTSASTTVTVTEQSSLSALKVGDTVVVQGSTGSDGSITATAVRSGAGGFGGPGGPTGRTDDRPATTTTAQP